MMVSLICCLSVIAVALAAGGCSAIPAGRVGDNLDPVPAWYDDEFRDSVYSLFADPRNSYRKTRFSANSIRELRLLAWQSFSTERDRVDSTGAAYQAMLWIHLVTPGTNREDWALMRVWGSPPKWRVTLTSHILWPIIVYDHPPTNADVYSANIWTVFFEGEGEWPIARVYDGQLRSNTWKSVIGEEPTHPFSVSRPK